MSIGSTGSQGDGGGRSIGDRIASGLSAFGSSLSKSSDRDSSDNQNTNGRQPEASRTDVPKLDLPSYRKGCASVPRTGLAKLHKGERVLTKAQNKRYSNRGGGRSRGR